MPTKLELIVDVIEILVLVLTIPDDDVLLEAGCERLPRELAPLCG